MGVAFSRGLAVFGGGDGVVRVGQRRRHPVDVDASGIVDDLDRLPWDIDHNLLDPIELGQRPGDGPRAMVATDIGHREQCPRLCCLGHERVPS
jgi:hypothetical protein